MKIEGVGSQKGEESMGKERSRKFVFLNGHFT